MYDVIIIGAGPAGISAGIYAKRAGAKVLILYSGESNLDKAEYIENYYGFVDGIEGKKLYKNGIEQALKLEIEVKKEEVIHIEKDDTKFNIKTEKAGYLGKTAIIATGNKSTRPNIKGIIQYEGKGISYCAICDGFFYRNKNVAVIGNGKFAKSEAEALKNIAGNVKILTNGESSQENFEFKTITEKIKEIQGNETVKQIEFEDGSKINVDGIFIAQGKAGSSDFAKKIGVILDKENIVVDENMETNVKGLYACGNATGGMLQICKAIYEGAKAGLAATKASKK